MAAKIKKIFVLVGKYPSHGQIWANSTLKGRAPPEAYGTIYHKKCYVETLTKSFKIIKNCLSLEEEQTLFFVFAGALFWIAFLK